MPIDPLITLGWGEIRSPLPACNAKPIHLSQKVNQGTARDLRRPRATADYRSSNYRVGGICPAAHSTTMPTLQLRCIPNSHCITAHDLEPWVHFQQTQGRSLHCTTRPLQLGQTVALEETLLQSEQSHIRTQSGAVEVEVAPTTG